MLELLFLLLPVAAAYGWYMGRRSAQQNKQDEANRLSRDYVAGVNFLLSNQQDKAVDLFLDMLKEDTGTVEAHPTVLPGVLLIGGVADELAGARKEQISGADLPGSAAYLEFTLAREHQVDQVMVTDARTPGLGRGAALNAAVEDGKFDVVRVVLFEGLLVNVCHGGLTSLVVTSFDQYTTEPPANSTKVHLIL